MNRKRHLNGYEVVLSKLESIQEGCTGSLKRLKMVKEGLILNLRTLESEADR
jgi:hypothetical protein